MERKLVIIPTYNEIENISKIIQAVFDIEGDYHIILHPYKLNHSVMQESTPSTIHLSADGKVTGGSRGSWSYTDEGKSYILVKLGSTSYYGVVVEQTLEGTNAKVLCFTAVSEDGVPCWGYKLQPQHAIAYNYKQYSDTYFKRNYFSRVSGDMDILFTPAENVTLSWTSSNPDVLSNTGKFTAPQEDTSFTMTARLESGNYYWQKVLSAKAVADPSSIQEVLICYHSFTSWQLLCTWFRTNKINC